MGCDLVPPSLPSTGQPRWPAETGRLQVASRGIGQDRSVATKTIPESTKTSLGQRLRARQRERWPVLASVQARVRGRFAYVDGELEGGEVLALCRLRYAGSASLWGFAIYLRARTATRTRCCQAAYRSAPPRKPWTAPASSTSPTSAPGKSTCHQPAPDHPRTSIRQHLAPPPAAPSAPRSNASRNAVD